MNLNTIMLLTASAENVMTMSERLAYALRMLVVGLGMVFVVLALLWGVLTLSRVIFYDMPRRRRQEEIKGHKAEGNAVTPASAPATAPAPVAPAQNNDVLIAVITAAISAAMAEEGCAPATGFRVVSFRRSTGNHPWNRV